MGTGTGVDEERNEKGSEIVESDDRNEILLFS
jgi:hypothetical protein